MTASSVSTAAVQAGSPTATALSSHVPLWRLFDAAWYRRRYLQNGGEAGGTSEGGQKLVGLDDQALEAQWRNTPLQSPNRFFDEEWYLRQYADVRRSVEEGHIFETGFQHYCEVGFRLSAPHWLFSEEHYFRQNPDLSSYRLLQEGWRNGYDHFLSVGDTQQRSGHPFFVPEVFLADCLKHGVVLEADKGLFAQFLSLEPQDKLKERRTSWYFSPEWYLERYPEVRRLIASGRYQSALHHYLTNDRPTSYAPDPDFSESWYQDHYPDVREAIQQGRFRNGYAHFLQAGVREGRKPHPNVDFAAYLRKRDLPQLLEQSGLEDAFALWVRERETGAMGMERLEIPVASARALATRRIETHMPGLMRKPLVFQGFAQSENQFPVSTPALSIVVLSEGDYLSVLATLTSLNDKAFSNIQVIVASQGNGEEKKVLAQTTRGVAFVYATQRLSLSQLAHQALEAALSPSVMFVQAGHMFFPGALRAVLKAREAGLSGTGQLLDVDLRVREAGGFLWRDGKMTPRGAGAEAYAEGVATRQEVTLASQGILFSSAQKVGEAFMGSAVLNSGPSFFPALSLMLQMRGEPLQYVPDVVVQGLAGAVPGREVTSYLRKTFPSTLVQQPLWREGAERQRLSSAGLKSGGRKSGRSILFLCREFPEHLHGGGSQKILDRVTALAALGWKVHLASLEIGPAHRLNVPLELPDTVQVHRGIGHEAEDLQAFLEEQAGVDILWLVGVGVLDTVAPALQESSVTARLVLETDDLHGNGLHAMEQYLRRRVGQRKERELLLEEARAELKNAWLCPYLVCGDEKQAQLLRDLGYRNVKQLRPLEGEKAVPSAAGSFQERQGLLFALPLHHAGDAGHDAFDWLALHVLPRLRKILGQDVPVWVGSYHAPEINLSIYGRFAALENLTSQLAYEELLSRCRVVVAPGRIVSGEVKELYEAARHGLPSIVTPEVMVRMGWQGGKQCVVASQHDPAEFAQKLAELYEGETLWEDIAGQSREWAQNRAEGGEDLETFLTDVLEGVALSGQEAALVPVHVGPEETYFSPAPLRLGPTALPPVRENPVEEEEPQEEIVPKKRLGVSLDEDWMPPRGGKS